MMATTNDEISAELVDVAVLAKAIVTYQLNTGSAQEKAVRGGRTGRSWRATPWRWGGG
jgi:hypothetical protein